MRVLLDTNAFLRWRAGAIFSRSVERVFKRADTEFIISIVTGWEILLKPKLGISSADFELSFEETGATLLPIRFRHLDELSRLPLQEHHRDPFDRMLIAQALAEDIPIVSGDARFPLYDRLRLLWD